MSAKYFYRLTLLFLAAIVVQLQNQCLGQSSISYSYDSNGNRTYRCIELLKSGSANDTTSVKKEFQDELEGVKIKIFPNPTQSLLTLEITDPDGGQGMECHIFNLSGTLLQLQKVTDSECTLDFSTYPAGIYILRLHTGGKSSEWKVIKE